MPVAPSGAPPAATRPAAAVAPAPAATAIPAPPKPAADADTLYRNLSERLKALQRLRDSGLITQKEYEDKRRQLLNEL